MTKTSKFALYGAVGLLGLLALAAIALPALLDAEAYKSRLEAAASAASGLEVRIGGHMGLRFFPGLQVTLEDVHVSNGGAELALAKQARLDIALVSLLTKAVRVEAIALQQPRFTIERDRNGRYNYERATAQAQSEADLPSLEWPSVTLSHGSLVYTDKLAGERLEAGDCQVDMRGVQLAAGPPAGLLKRLSLTAQLACTKVLREGFVASDLKLSADVKNGRFDLKPLTANVHGARGSGNLLADYSGAMPVYHLQVSLPQFPVEEFMPAQAQHKLASGRMDLNATLSMRGKTRQEMRQSASGTISVRGKNLTLSGADLDGQFSRFESSQNFNIVDVGAFFFAGPMGVAVTKGFNFASLLQGAPGSQSEVRTLVSDWKVERGVARAQDVAMATKENRIALQGEINLANDQFEDVVIALVDENGCAKLRQRISGSFQNPVVEKPNPLQTLAGPALSLLKKGGKLLTGGKCDVFYAGSVAAPK